VTLARLPPSGSTLMALGFSRLVCIEVLFVSIPSARYTDKADGQRRLDELFSAAGIAEKKKP
jgi:hypothetical protein